MEYFWLKIRTGAPQGYDKAGGVHIENTPQIVEICCESMISRCMRKLKTKLLGDTTIPAGLPDMESLMPLYEGAEPMFAPKYAGGDFTVEIPSSVDVSKVTGMLRIKALGFKRVDNIFDAEEAPAL